jgi:hypothetical protein
MPTVIQHEAVSLGGYAYRIRGAAKNNVMLAGDAGMVWHWNGTTWNKYEQLSNADYRLYSIATSSTMAIAIGRSYTVFPSPALIVLGKR